MADRIIVATFTNTNAAYDAATALKGLKDKRSRFQTQSRRDGCEGR